MVLSRPADTSGGLASSSPLAYIQDVDNSEPREADEIQLSERPLLACILTQAAHSEAKAGCSPTFLYPVPPMVLAQLSAPTMDT